MKLNETICSLFNIVGVYVAVKNIKVNNVTRETQQYVPFALLFSYKIFPTAANSNKYYTF